MKKVLLFAVIGLLALTSFASANPIKDAYTFDDQPFQGTLNFRDVGVAPEGPGTIQYDTGTFTGVGSMPMVADNFSFGNNFGPCALPFTVTNLSIFAAIIDGSTTAAGNAFVTVFGPLNTAGTSAPALTSASAPLMANAFATFAISQQFTGTAGSSTFQAGVWNPGAGSTSAAVPCGTDCVGFDSNDGGDGFHGMAVEDLGGGNFTPITNANAILRVSGPNVPVELMSFSIED